MPKVTSAVEISKNEKTGYVSATYAPIQSCPSSCPFKDNGCYAQGGNCGVHFRRMSNAAQDKSLVEIAQDEANQIDKLQGLFDLRVHVTGDCSTDETAQIVSEACARFTEKQGKTAWAYTHAWKQVDRKSWGTVTVKASCETVQAVVEATEKGYSAALVTSLDRLALNVKALAEKGFKPVLCRNFVNKTQCVSCRKCLKDDNKTVVLIPTHGATFKRADEAIKKLNK